MQVLKEMHYIESFEKMYKQGIMLNDEYYEYYPVMHGIIHHALVSVFRKAVYLGIDQLSRMLSKIERPLTNSFNSLGSVMDDPLGNF